MARALIKYGETVKQRKNSHKIKANAALELHSDHMK